LQCGAQSRRLGPQLRHLGCRRFIHASMFSEEGRPVEGR
jgi:hypothetical protein